jgi:polysaccharide biosynthesis transport protein
MLDHSLAIQTGTAAWIGDLIVEQCSAGFICLFSADSQLDAVALWTISLNPAELIASGRMRELLQTAAQQYDHILIDSPPLLNVPDPAILSTLVDRMILVV